MLIAQPIAFPPEGDNPVTFYANFAGKLQPNWDPASGLDVWLADSSEIARLHAPLRSAIRFVPTGTELNGAVTTENVLRLQTWPTSFPELKRVLGPATPAEVHFLNVDDTAVRTAVEPLFAALGKSEAAVGEFMSGGGLLKVETGTTVGAAAVGSTPPSSTVPKRVHMSVFGATGELLNTIDFLSRAADHAGVDKSIHPLLSQLDLNGWIEVIALSSEGTPLSSEPYELFLGDATSRTGTTDAEGRVYETGIPPGRWGIDFLNHPSFALEGE